MAVCVLPSIKQLAEVGAVEFGKVPMLEIFTCRLRGDFIGELRQWKG